MDKANLNKLEIEFIMNCDLGITIIKMAQLLDCTPAHIELLISGDEIADGETVMELFRFIKLYKIPRISNKLVKSILSEQVDINIKAGLIQGVDKDLSARETNNRLPKLMTFATIVEHLNNRYKDGIDG